MVHTIDVKIYYYDMTHSSKMVLPSKAHPKHFTIAKSTIEVDFYAFVRDFVQQQSIDFIYR